MLDSVAGKNFAVARLMESWWSDATPGNFIPSECFIDLFIGASISNGGEDGPEEANF